MATSFRTFVPFLTVLATVSIIAIIQLGATPLERALGLAHGQILSTPQKDFLVFDHLTKSGAETLNRKVHSLAAQPAQLVVVEGYGLWRMAILLALVYGLTLTGIRAVSRLRLRDAVVIFRRETLLLVSTVVGVSSAVYGVGDVGPTLFAVSFFGLMVAATQSRPDPQKVATGLELLDLFRAFWGGWLLPKLFVLEATWGGMGEVQAVGLAVGVVASFLVASGIKFPSHDPGVLLKGSCQRSFAMGCWESMALLLALTLSAALGRENLCGAISVLGAFGWGRVVHSALLRHVLTIDPVVTPGHRRESSARIAAGVWFVSPWLASGLIPLDGSTGLMIWFLVLLPLVKSGRPWGSVAGVKSLGDPVTPVPVAPLDTSCQTTRVAPDDREAYLALKPIERAAVLLMVVTPQTAAQIFNQLDPEEVHATTLAITQLPRIQPGVRAMCLEDFMNSEITLRHSSRSTRALELVEDWVCRDPGAAACRLRELEWLGVCQRSDPLNTQLDLVELHISKSRKLAIVLFCLPDRMLDRVLCEMPKAAADRAREELRALPSMLPEIRALVIREFLGAPRYSRVSEDPFQALEAAFTTDVPRFTWHLVKHYLPEILPEGSEPPEQRRSALHRGSRGWHYTAPQFEELSYAR